MVEPTSFNDLVHAVRAFRDERDWAQFHTPRHLATSIVLEAAELLEHFQWKDDDAASEHCTEQRGAIADEVADLQLLLISAADALGIDIVAHASDKLARNAVKYPVERAKGNAQKYDRLA